MRRLAILAAAVGTALAAAGQAAWARCDLDGERTQSVYLSSGSRDIERWESVYGVIHRSTLPNGFVIGVKLDPVAARDYREMMARAPWPAMDELVRVTLYDLSGAEPKTIASTTSGANSLQRFGLGGVAGVKGLPDPPVTLWLHKAVCVKAGDVADLAR